MHNINVMRHKIFSDPRLQRLYHCTLSVVCGSFHCNAANTIKRYFSCRHANDQLSGAGGRTRPRGLTLTDLRRAGYTDVKTAGGCTQARDEALRRGADLWQEDKLRRFKAITREQPA